MPHGMRVFGGSANPALTKAICEKLSIPEGEVVLKRFADQELYPQFVENIRGCDVFLIQPTCAPVNDNLMELILMINAAKLASAARITAVVPYMGYARQDRKDRPRVPISAKVVAAMLEAAGVDRVLTMDLHSAPIQGFFNVPVDHLYALPVFIDYLNAEYVPEEVTYGCKNLVVVSPDVGGVFRARLMATKLGVKLAIVDKFREAANVSEVMNVVGNVKDKDCLLVDDMIDTAGTLCKGAVALMERGATSVHAVATHGLFSLNALEKIEDSPIIEVLVTDTIPQNSNWGFSSKLNVLSVAPIFSNAIKAIHDNDSISSLFL